MAIEGVVEVLEFDGTNLDSLFSEPKPHEWDLERIKKIEAKLDKHGAWDDPEPKCLSVWEQRYFLAYCGEVYYNYLSDCLVEEYTTGKIPGFND